MDRIYNEFFMEKAYRTEEKTFAIRIESDGDSNICSVAGVFDPKEKRITILQKPTGDISESCYSTFDSEAIVDEWAKTVFNEAAKRTEIKEIFETDPDSPFDFLKKLGIKADDYNSLEITQEELAEIIDLFKDGIYLFRFTE